MVMMKLKEVEIPALHKLTGYLEAVSEFIRTGELKWYFDVRLYECEEGGSDIRLFIKHAYPNAKIEQARISEIAVDDVVETLDHELGRFCPPVEALRVLGPISTYTAAMWQYLGECIEYEDARIFEYFAPEKDSLLSGMMGDFAIIFYNEEQNRWLVFTGATCD